jgi:ATP-dependent Clp protease ATP-binding subunit ClpA
MAHAVATRWYSRQASRSAKRALARLGPRTRRCTELAEEAARAGNDNHVGTEHIVLGLIAGAPEVASALSKVGITRAVFEAQLLEEPGTSPNGPIPFTPRALRILGFALEESEGLGSESIEPIHMLLGVIDESEYWGSLRADGPHHLAQAAGAVGQTLHDVRSAALATLSTP